MRTSMPCGSGFAARWSVKWNNASPPRLPPAIYLFRTRVSRRLPLSARCSKGWSDPWRHRRARPTRPCKRPRSSRCALWECSMRGRGVWWRSLYRVISSRPGECRQLVQRQRHPFHPRLFVIGDMKTKLGTHLQHGCVFVQDLPVHDLQTFLAGISDHVFHQEPAQTPTLEVRTHKDSEFRAVAAGIVMESHDAEHAAARFRDGDESHGLFRVIVDEPVDQAGTDFAQRHKKAQAQIVSAYLSKKVRIKCGIVGLQWPDENLLAVAQHDVAFEHHRIASRTRPCASATSIPAPSLTRACRG